ncbi:MAG: MGMT family protein [Cyanophyceae cyanobacterium]
MGRQSSQQSDEAEQAKQAKQNAYDKIYAVVRLIPFGKVATYGQIAELAGYGGKARLVGYALFRVAEDGDIPWQRVINAKGQVSESVFRNGSDFFQRSLLEAEGIELDDKLTVDFKACRWHPTDAELAIIDELLGQR